MLTRTKNRPGNHNGNKLKEFGTLIDPFMDRLYRTALIMTKNPRTAKKLVEDAYLNAKHQFHKSETGCKFGIWMFQILISTFRKQYISKNTNLSYQVLLS